MQNTGQKTEHAGEGGETATVDRITVPRRAPPLPLSSPHPLPPHEERFSCPVV